MDTMEDNTPYKELIPFVQTIKEQQKKKMETAQMRQEFTANVSHELKTPLTSISGYAEMIETGLAQTEDIPVFAEKIHSESQRLLELIGDIMKLSELDESKKDLFFERIDFCLLYTSLPQWRFTNVRKWPSLWQDWPRTLCIRPSG